MKAVEYMRMKRQAQKEYNDAITTYRNAYLESKKIYQEKEAEAYKRYTEFMDKLVEEFKGKDQTMCIDETGHQDQYQRPANETGQAYTKGQARRL